MLEKKRGIFGDGKGGLQENFCWSGVWSVMGVGHVSKKEGLTYKLWPSKEICKPSNIVPYVRAYWFKNYIQPKWLFQTRVDHSFYFRFIPGNYVILAKRNWTIIKRTDNVVPHKPLEFSCHTIRIVRYVLVPPSPPKARGLFEKKND